MKYYIVTKISSPDVIGSAFSPGGALFLLDTKEKAEDIIKDHILHENQKHYCVEEVYVFNRGSMAVVKIETPPGVRVQISSTDEEAS